jgi:DNA-binding phage protein
MKKTSKLVGVGSHHEREVEELREDRAFAVAYLQVAMESLDNPEERAGGLIALRAVAEAYGGLGAVAAQAGISRESLYPQDIDRGPQNRGAAPLRHRRKAG